MATKYPPQLSVAESIRAIKEMYATHKSKEVSLDLMPAILKVSPKSSYFPMAILALQKFGLIEKRPNDLIELTESAMQIINPIGDDDRVAIINLFAKEEVLSILIDKYPNGILPSEERLQQILMKTFEIPRDTVKKWYRYVIDSLREFPFNRAVTAPKEDIPITNNSQTKIKEDYQNFNLPSGKKFSFYLGENYTLKDLNFITNFFELLKKGIEK